MVSLAYRRGARYKMRQLAVAAMPLKSLQRINQYSGDLNISRRYTDQLSSSKWLLYASYPARRLRTAHAHFSWPKIIGTALDYPRNCRGLPSFAQPFDESSEPLSGA